MSVVAQVRETHEQRFGVAPTHVAVAHGTYPLMGEATDYYGGAVLMGLSDLPVAVAISPSDDDVITLGDESITLTEVARRASEQTPGIDAHGRPTIPEAPLGGPAARLGGVVWSLIHRQLISRDTGGVNVTAVSTIPRNAGLGLAEATDCAFALALTAMSGEPIALDDAPLRAKLSDALAFSAQLFSSIPSHHARFATNLRGSHDHVALVNYADGSISQAPISDSATFVVARPVEPRADATEQERFRRRFLDEACRSFGTESLRHLPDAPMRIAQWLQAVHDVHGPEGTPTVAQAVAWLRFYEDETARTLAVARLLASPRGDELWQLINSSASAAATVLPLAKGTALAELSRSRGALAARPVGLGVFDAAVAHVPGQRASNFAADLREDGLIVVELLPGKAAHLV